MSAEQEFLNSFVKTFSKTEKIEILHNNCRSKKNNPDLKFRWNDAIWFVEAKISTNDDKYNAVHKLFGELLKITGIKTDEKNIKYGLLIDNKEFFSSHFKYINSAKFITFGKLIPIEKIFVYENGNIEQYTWNEILTD